ncbi:MAG: hypothetical protein K6G22_05460 [Lachnospiraceae bacterium]|nr:hypothetical protein [Lachnospiraceae bacterium]
MSWTQKELEELFQKANEKAVRDPDFRKQVLEDPNKALSELAGKDLPEGLKLTFVEGDSRYTAAYLTPDFAGGELDLTDLKSVAGGEGEQGRKPEDVQAWSVVLIVTVCAAAVSTSDCSGDVCGAALCEGDLCAANICGAALCDNDVFCFLDGCLTAACPSFMLCTGEVCGAAYCNPAIVCAADYCSKAICGRELICAVENCNTAQCPQAMLCQWDMSPSEQNQDDGSGHTIPIRPCDAQIAICAKDGLVEDNNNYNYNIFPDVTNGPGTAPVPCMMESPLIDHPVNDNHVGNIDVSGAVGGMPDMGTPDLGSPDPGVGGGMPDPGIPDAGGFDPGTTDTGGFDPGVSDAGGSDAGTPDVGGSDAGAADAGADVPVE